MGLVPWCSYCATSRRASPSHTAPHSQSARRAKRAQHSTHDSHAALFTLRSTPRAASRSSQVIEERAVQVGKTKNAGRLMSTGRSSRYRIEPKLGYQALGTDAFLEAMNSLAGTAT